MIAERLIQARKAAGLSVQALSAKAGGVVTPQAISKYEKGKCKPTSATLLALAKALGCTGRVLLSPLDRGPGTHSLQEAQPGAGQDPKRDRRPDPGLSGEVPLAGGRLPPRPISLLSQSP